MPATNSMAMKSTPSWLSKSKMPAMCGWLSLDRATAGETQNMAPGAGRAAGGVECAPREKRENETPPLQGGPRGAREAGGGQEGGKKPPPKKRGEAQKRRGGGPRRPPPQKSPA